MPTNVATAADLDLQRQCAGIGVPVTTRQLQTYRRLHLVPGPVVVRHGRGKGTESVYPAGTAQEVERVARAFGSLGKQHLVVLGMFGVGVTPTERAVRDAYRWLLDRWEEHVANALARLEESGVAGRQYVRRLASEAGRSIPGGRERWTGRARDVAAAERAASAELDKLSATPMEQWEMTSSRDIRERDVTDYYESLLGREQGDPAGFMTIFGFDESETTGSVSRIGAPPDFAEYRATLDDVTFYGLVQTRDDVRAQWESSVVPMMPPPVVEMFREHWDDPTTAGPGVAMIVLSSLATIRRAMTQSERREDESAAG